MAEYIDRETVYRFCKEQIEKETGAYSKGRNAGLRVAMSAVMNNECIPAADVRPVVRGTWAFKGYDHGLKVCECSSCKKRAYGSTNFCSNCGAMMEES